MRRRRGWRIAGCLILLSLMVAGSGWWIRSKMPQTCRLPDGTVLTLRGWYYGKKPVLKQRVGPWWELWSRPAEIEGPDTETDVLTLWVSGVPLVSRQVMRGMTSTEAQHWWDRVEVADEQGHSLASVNGVFPGPNGTYHISQNVTESGPLDGVNECVQIQAFPRRGRQVIVRFYSNQQKQPIAVLTVPNPTPGPFPDWKPESLPITRREGSLECTLTQFAPAKTYLYLNRQDGGSGYNSSPGLLGSGYERIPTERRHAVFQIRDTDNPRFLWSLKALTLTDATGNHLDPDSMIENDFHHPMIDFNALHGAEPLRLRAEFLRDADSEFAPNELWTVSGLAVPRANKITRSQAKWSREGVTIELLGIAGTGKTRFDSDPTAPVLTSDAPAVRLRITPAGSSIHLMLRGKDNQGRDISKARMGSNDSHHWVTEPESFPGASNTITDFDSKNGSMSGGPLDKSANYSETTLFLHIPPGAKSLNLTFAINKSRFVEFTPVLPPIPQSPPPGKE